jgi:hypothetical protein
VDRGVYMGAVAWARGKRIVPIRARLSVFLNVSPTRALAKWAGDPADRPRSVRSGPRDVFFSKSFISFLDLLKKLAARFKSQINW